MHIFHMSRCNIAQTIAETSRFVFHALLIQLCTFIIDRDTDILNKRVFKVMLVTAMAVICYNLFLRKIVEPPLKKMKIICKKDRSKKEYEKYTEDDDEDETDTDEL